MQTANVPSKSKQLKAKSNHCRDVVCIEMVRISGDRTWL